MCSGDVAGFRCQTILFFVSREAMALIGAVGGAWWRGMQKSLSHAVSIVGKVTPEKLGRVNLLIRVTVLLGSPCFLPLSASKNEFFNSPFFTRAMFPTY